MAKSTADLVDWRSIYAPQQSQEQKDWWDQRAKQSQAAQTAINNMPFMFDPVKFFGMDPNAMLQLIHTGATPRPTAPQDAGLLTALGLSTPVNPTNMFVRGGLMPGKK